MENASKALLIAGSVLIAILLIAFGVKIFSTGSHTADSLGTSMQTAEIANFNANFTSYVGNNKSEAQVRALADIVIASNAKNPSHKVSLNGKNAATAIMNYISSLTKDSYKISISTYDSKGYITYITIS